MKAKLYKEQLFSIFFIVMFLFSFSCGDGRKENKSFPKETEIVFTKMNVGENLGRVLRIKSSNSYLIAGEKNLETQIQLTHLHRQ
jgi:hypothetical protein